MKITSVSSLCLWSENPKKLAKFYSGVLNLPFDKELTYENDRGIQYKVGDFYFFVGYHDKIKGKSKDPYRMMLGFDVPSVKEAYEELIKKKVKFIQKPIISPSGTFYVATALDPEGNIFQLYSDKL